MVEALISSVCAQAVLRQAFRCYKERELWNVSMRRLIVVSLVALAAIGVLPVSAKVLSEGKLTSDGFYWQKVQKKDGSVQYICQSSKESGIQKNAKCDGAKAVKPK
jgi:hypothetical protein